MVKTKNQSGKPAPTVTDQAYSGIIDLILHQKLRPGERTSVNLLAGHLGFGRTPIKEAVTRLQTEGLLSVSGRSGTTVNLIEPEQAEQLFALRRVLEGFAAEGAVRHATSEQIRRVKELARDMRRHSLGRGEVVPAVARFIDSNVEFHALIVAATGNRFLVRLYSQIQMQLQIVTYLVRSGFDPRAAIRRQDEHEAIANALADRDAKRLKAALLAHAQTTERAILSTLAVEGYSRGSARHGPARHGLKRRAI